MEKVSGVFAFYEQLKTLYGEVGITYSQLGKILQEGRLWIQQYVSFVYICMKKSQLYMWNCPAASDVWAEVKSLVQKWISKEVDILRM